MSRSFRPEFLIDFPGRRSPSPPPPTAIEPLSPPPGWQPPLSYPSLFAGSRKRRFDDHQRDDLHDNGSKAVNGQPRNPDAKNQHAHSLTPRSPPSALDVFAAVATSPSLAQDINSPAAFHSPPNATYSLSHTRIDKPEYERASKRSRSEVFSERPATLQDTRPITSHVSSLAHYHGQPPVGRNLAVQSNGVLEQDAELLLMFSRGSHNPAPLFPPNPYALHAAELDVKPLAAPFDIISPTEQRLRESKPLLPSFAHNLESPEPALREELTEPAPVDLPSVPDASDAPAAQPARPREHRGWPKGKPRGPRGPGAARKKKNEPGTKRAEVKDDAEGIVPERKRGRQRKSANNSASSAFGPFSVPGHIRQPRRRSFHTTQNITNEHEKAADLPKRSASAPRDPYAGVLVAQTVNGVLKISGRGKKQKRSPDDTEFCLLCRSDSKSMQTAQDLWINCNGCKAWIHAGCAGFDDEKKIKEVDKYYCERCETRHGQTTYVRKSSRAHTSVDYAGLNEGKIRAPEDVYGHHYIEPIKNGTFKFPPETFARMPPELVNAEYFAKLGGWKEPILIPAELNPRPKPVSTPGKTSVVPETSSPDECTGSSEDAFSEKFEYECVPDEGQDKLDMVMPHGLTVRRVADLHGPETNLAVIDVKLQEGEDKWSLGRWADYYEAIGDKPVRNVISLEVSRSKLGRLIRRPKVVRDLDLQDSVWPEEETAKGNFPRVQFYCLMSVADCYTDFHIDFGGSSVYYHILKGRKTFFFIPPTQKNLKKYEEWCKSPNQNNIWLGDETKECYRVDLYPGDTMLIPSGWIHSVWTPEDSLVIGGNFLTRLHYGMQINVHAIEKATEVSAQFRYPFFQKIMWLAIAKYLERDPVPSTVVDLFSSPGAVFERKEPVWIEGLMDPPENDDDDPELHNARYYPEAELEGLPELLRFVHRTAMISQGLVPGITKKQQEAVGRSIPKGFGDPIELLKTGAIWAAWKRGNETIPSWALPDAPLSESEPVIAEKRVSMAAQKRLERQALIDAIKRDPNARTLRPSSEKPNAESTPVKVPSPAASGVSPSESSRPACDHCRSRKRRCEHKSAVADVIQSRDETVPARFGVRYISRASEFAQDETPLTDEPLPVDPISVKKEAPLAEAIVNPVPPAPVHEAAPVNPIQMPTVPSAEALQFNPAQFAAPLPPLVMQTPAGPRGAPSVEHSPLTQSKRPKTKACADCKKSKRRCIHDSNGKIDPIKAQEIPQPRPQAHGKRNKAGSREGSRPGSSKKSKHEADGGVDFSSITQPGVSNSAIVMPDANDIALASDSMLTVPPARTEPMTVLDPALEILDLPEHEERRRPLSRASVERKERSRSRTSSSNQQTSGSDSAKAAYSTTASPLTEPDTVPLYLNGGVAPQEEQLGDQIMTGIDNESEGKEADSIPPGQEPPDISVSTNGVQDPVGNNQMAEQKSHSPRGLEEVEDESVRLARMLAGQEHGLRRRG